MFGVILDTEGGEMLRERILSLLNERGWTIAELSKRSGVPIDTIKNITSGKITDPRLSTLEALADAFGISINCLIGKCPHTPKEKTLLRQYKECDRHGKSIIELVARHEAGAIKSERDATGKHTIPCVKPYGDMHKGILWDSSKTENEYTSNRDSYIGIQMPNDDFAPLYCEGDIVLLEDRIPHDGEIAGVLIHDRAYLRKIIKEKEGYRLKCLHHYGEDIIIKRMDEIIFIGTVNGTIRS